MGFARTRRAVAGIVALSMIALVADAADRRLRTYPMQHSVPEQVLPALQPLLSDGSSAQAFQNQLILNVTDAEYRTALELLQQLDVAARSLLISVRKSTDAQRRDAQYGIDGRIGTGDVQVRTGDGYSSRPPSSQTEVRAIDSSQNSRRDGSQQVRAVEGMPAFISAGSAQLVTTRQSAYGSTRELVPVESGFYATARVIGSDVIIDIDQRDDRMQGRTIDTQGIQTQVRGRVGEWIAIGGLDQSRSNERSGLTGSANQSQSARGDIALKVELAP